MQCFARGRFALRVFQFASSLAALLSLFSCFRVETRHGHEIMLGSLATSIAIVATYSASLYSCYLLITAMRTKKQASLRQQTKRYVDVGFAGVLVLAGAVLVSSDYVSICDRYGDAINCDLLETATACIFISAVIFLSTALLYPTRMDLPEPEDEEDSEGLLSKAHRA